MSNEDLIKDIINSNEMLRVQIWIMGGVLSAVGVVGIFLVREAWTDMKEILENHTSRIMILERNDAVMETKINSL